MITVTVSQLNRYVKSLLEEDSKLSEIYVKGEISNFNRHFQSGHCYFSLKDKNASVRCVMFSRNAAQLRFQPENGMAVILGASVSVYERDGAYQLYVTDLQPDGAGSLAVAFAQLKDKLQKDGLFDDDHKQPLPPCPRRVGIITSDTGAAKQDILSVLSRRYPICTAVFCAATVQGETAAKSLVQALETVDDTGNCDVIIIGRGGGSAEDLWVFNDPALAYAVYRCKTPVISAVGHEIDYSICDFVADLRAPTPSAAAELAVPNITDLGGKVADCEQALHYQADQLLSYWKQRLARLQTHRDLADPMTYVLKKSERLDFYQNALYNRKRIIMRNAQSMLVSRAALLNSLSPLRVLERGYGIPYKGDAVVRSVEELRAGDKLRLRLRDGYADTAVYAIQKEGPAQ